MKQFDKWWCKHWDENYEGAMRGDMEESWKAALEWVQNARFRSTDEPLHIDKPLYDMLEEELESE